MERIATVLRFIYYHRDTEIKSFVFLLKSRGIMPRHGEVKRAAQVVKPFKPFKPFEPFEPFEPLKPLKPLKPFEPFEPFEPFKPLKPFKLTLRVVLVEHSVNSLDTFLCAEAAEE